MMNSSHCWVEVCVLIVLHREHFWANLAKLLKDCLILTSYVQEDIYGVHVIAYQMNHWSLCISAMDWPQVLKLSGSR